MDLHDHLPLRIKEFVTAKLELMLSDNSRKTCYYIGNRDGIQGEFFESRTVMGVQSLEICTRIEGSGLHPEVMGQGGKLGFVGRDHTGRLSHVSVLPADARDFGTRL